MTERLDLLDRLRRGESSEQARDGAGVSRHRLVRERKVNPQFATELRQAAAQGRKVIRDEVYGLALEGDRAALALVVPNAKLAARQDHFAMEVWEETLRGKPPKPNHYRDQAYAQWRRTWSALYRKMLNEIELTLFDLIPEADRPTARQRLATLAELRIDPPTV